MKHDMKPQDVFRWYYKDCSDRFEPYHCKSRIAMFDGDVLYDTFWGNKPHNNHWFNAENCNELIEIQFLGNLDDFEPCSKHDQAMYDDKDFLDISHSNRSGEGSYYKRKGVPKSLDKMRKILKRNALEAERVYENAKSDYKRMLEKLDDLTEDSYVWASNDVPMGDEHYYDDMELKGI